MNNEHNQTSPDNVMDHLQLTASPLRKTIIGFAVVLFMISLVIAVELNYDKTHALQQAESTARNLASMLARSVGSVFEKTDLMLQHLAHEVIHEKETGGIRENELAAFIDHQLHSMKAVDSLGVTDAAGLVTIGGVSPTLPVSLADRDYFVYLRDHPESGMLISKPIISRISKKNVISCARRITLSDGSFGGIAFATYPVDELQRILSDTPVDKHGSISLRHADFDLIVRITPGMNFPNKESAGDRAIFKDWRALIENGKTDEGAYNSISVNDGIKRLYSYRKVTPYALYVNVGFAHDDIFSEFYQEVIVALVSLLLMVIVSIIIIRLLRSNWSHISLEMEQRTQAQKDALHSINRLKLMQEVSEYHAVSVQDLLDFTLDKVVALTESSIGYIYHYDEESRLFTLNSWSKDVMAECRVTQPQAVYQLEKTGVWGEAVRQRAPVMVNNFDAPNPYKKGYPEGHIHLSSFLSVPVFENNRIVAVVGVGNKLQPYTESDRLQLTLMMHGVWKIADKFKLEEQIRVAGSEWQKTFDSISDSVCLVDADQKIIRCNRATCKILNLTFSDIIGKNTLELFHGADIPIDDSPLLRAKKSLHSENSVVKAGDSWLEITIDPIVSEHNEISRMVHIVRDVSERMSLMTALQEVNGLFRQVMKNTPIYAIIKEVTESESIVLEASDNYYDMLGITSEKMIGKSMHEIFPPELADKITSDDRRVVESGQMQMLEEELHGGNYITYKFPITRSDDRHLLAGFTVDITDRKRMEEELVNSKRFVKATMDSLGAHICILDCDGTIVAVNAPWKQFAEENGGNPARLSVGANYLDVCRSVKGEEAKTALECATAINDLLIGADVVDYQFEYPCHSPVEKRWFVCRLSSFVHNRQSYLVLAHENITQRKLAEEANKELQSQMMQSEKLATIGQLAAGVAHEINNPMAFIGSNMITMEKYIEKYNRYIAELELELKQKSDGELPEDALNLFTGMKLGYVMQDIHTLLAESVAGVDHIKQIVADLKTYARADTLKTARADINASIESTLNIVHNEIKYFATIHKEYDPELPRIECNIQQLNQVFLNLLVNASHAIQAKGEEIGVIAIKTWHDNESVLVSVSDTGCGIPPGQLDKVFDAFYTTKEVGKGTGLGLSISAGIARKHGGEITVNSQVGVGTTFTVRLPIEGNGNKNQEQTV